MRFVMSGMVWTQS